MMEAETGLVDTEGPKQGDDPVAAPYSIQDALEQDGIVPVANITPYFSDAQLSSVASKVIEGYESDLSCFYDRKEKLEEYYKLALQVIESKDYPFEGASNIKYPLLTEAAISFSSIAYLSLIRNGEVVKAKVLGSDEGQEPLTGPDGEPLVDPKTGKTIRPGEGEKARRGQRVSTHINYQLLEESTSWEDDLDRILTIIPIVGQAYRKTYYCNEGKTVESDLVLPQYLVVDPDAKSLDKATRITEEITLYPDEIETCIRMGLMRTFNYGSASSHRAGDLNVQGEEGASGADKSTPHVFLEQHCRIDLDDDGYAEPYIVWVHKESNQVVRIMARFDMGGVTYTVQDDGEVQISCIKPHCSYTKYGFMPNPVGGFYDIGFGDLLYGLNNAVNTSINQLIDSGHRYVMGGGFIGRELRLKGGNMRFKPGEYKQLNSTGADIRDNVFPLPMPEPSTVLFQLMNFLIEAGGNIGRLAKASMGDIPANMPVTTAMASIEQGMMPFKRVFKRLYRSVKSELAKVYRLNSIYLDEQKYNDLLDNGISIEDYSTTDYAIVPYADPEMVNSVQRYAKAQYLDQLKDDPYINPIEARRYVLETMGVLDAEKYIMTPQPQGLDPVVEAQLRLYGAQIQKIENDIMVDNSKISMEAQKRSIEEERAEVEMQGKRVEMAKDMAELDQMDADGLGYQMDIYTQNIMKLNQELEQGLIDGDEL